MYGSSIQSRGVIGDLIASLAGSLLPFLLCSNGLYRAGTKPAPSQPSKKGNGQYRAETKSAPPKDRDKKLKKDRRDVAYGSFNN